MPKRQRLLCPHPKTKNVCLSTLHHQVLFGVSQFHPVHTVVGHTLWPAWRMPSHSCTHRLKGAMNSCASMDPLPSTSIISKSCCKSTWSLNAATECAFSTQQSELCLCTYIYKYFITLVVVGGFWEYCKIISRLKIVSATCQ